MPYRIWEIAQVRNIECAFIPGRCHVPSFARGPLPAIAARLYAGVLDASDWYAGLDAIRCATGGTWFYQFAVDMRSMGVAASLHNSASRAEIPGGYEIDQALHDERMPLIMGMPVGQVMYDRQHITTRLSSRGLFTVTGCPP